jgi:hypothetical protein
VLDSLAQRREAGEISPELAGDIATRVASELVRLRTLSGLNLEEAETALDRLEASGQTTLRAEAIARYRGLIAAHRGERAAAETLLGPIAENGDDLALLGLAIAAEEADDRQTAVGRYAQVARRAPGNAIGLWARERLSRLLGAPIRPSDVARRLNRLAADAPRQLDRMAADTTEYLTLRVELPDGRLDPLAPVLARVEILNGGIFPLAIGADAPVVSRVLLAPKLAVSGRVVPAGNVPEIISMNRKLRLRPNETVVADAWLTAGALGALVDAMAPIAASIRVQAIQGFQWAEERESYVAGPFSLADSSDAVWRRPERVEPTAQEIVESIGSATGADLLRAVLEARWLFLQPAPAAEAEAMIARHRSLAEALAARYSSMSDAEQAFTLLMVPSAAQVPPAAAIEEAALAEPPAPLSTIVMLLSRAGSLDHPAFERARSLDDEAARGIAERLALRLEIAERLAQQRRSAADGD